MCFLKMLAVLVSPFLIVVSIFMFVSAFEVWFPDPNDCMCDKGFWYDMWACYFGDFAFLVPILFLVIAALLYWFAFSDQRD